MVKKHSAALFNMLWLLAPSIMWSVACHGLNVCVDPFFIQFIERRLPRAAALVLRGAWAVAAVVALLYVWNISPPTYLFYLREALPFSPPSIVISVAVSGVLMASFVGYRGMGLMSPRASSALAGLGAAMLFLKLLTIMVAGQSAPLQQRVKSQAMIIARMGYEWRFPNHSERVSGSPQVTFNSFVRQQKSLPPKLILMVVESWGERPVELRRISADMQSDRLEVVDAGFTTYRGATLSGEIRELCSQYMAPTDDLQDAANFDCAPAALQKRGYAVLGVHGYDKAFYARETFWRRFGISKTIFRDELPGLEHCAGPFDGVCDQGVIRRGIEMLDADSQKRLVYMLTLSSHEPLDPAALTGPPARYFRDVQVLHPTQIVTRRAISDLLVELGGQRSQACTLVYIVGDHQPPSASASRDIFTTDEVPFIAFRYACAN